MNRQFFFLSVLLWFFIPVSSLLAALVIDLEPVKIAVLAYRPKPETLTRWKPLESYFKEKIPERNFVVVPLNYDELNEAIATRQVDFILTNPGHYIQAKANYNLSSPLASLLKQDGDLVLSAFAGVIFTLSDREDINEQRDIVGKRIAVTKTASLGGFQMQSFALFTKNLPLPDEKNILLTGMPHDNVVDAVLAGRAEVGFVRTGVLESLQLDKRVDLSRIKIINAQAVPDFPYQFSTRLYPEWPFVAMSHIDQELAIHFTAALLLLHDHEVHKVLGIKGFQIPMNYSSVEDVLRALRYPPFEAAPAFTLHDIWHRYLMQIIVAVFLLLLVIFLGLALFSSNRRLISQKQEIIAEADKHRVLLSSLIEGVYGVDSKGYCIFINPAALNLLGYTELEVLGKNQHKLFHLAHDNEGDLKLSSAHQCPVLQTVLDGITRKSEEIFSRKNGDTFYVMINVASMQLSDAKRGAVVTFRDVSLEKKMAARDEMLVAALEAVQSSVVITDREARVEWVNPAYEKLTGYGYSEVKGRLLLIL